MTMSEIAAQMTLETIRSFRSGGAPHTMITGQTQDREAALVRIYSAARADGELADKWVPVRIDVGAAEGPDGMWERAAEALGESPGDAEPPLVTLERAMQENGRKVLILADGFDQLLSRCAANDTDWGLRKTLQTEPGILIVGSGSTLPEDATAYDQAFFEFFTRRRATA